MAIREATTSVEEPRPPRGSRPDRRRRRRDLRVGPFPTAAMEQWQDTEAALTQLYRYAEGRAIDAIDWYLADKRGKRICRAACACSSSSWSPPAASSPCWTPPPRPRPHRLGRRPARPGRRLPRLRPLLRPLLRLDALHDHRPGPGAPPRAAPEYDWAAECARSASRTVDPKHLQNRLALLRAFSDDVAAQLQQETAEWVLEFQSNLLRLERARSNGAATRPGSVPLPSAAEP